MDIAPLKDPAQMRYEASAALFVYELRDENPKDKNESFYNRPDAPACYVTMHRIQDGMVCEGAPVTKRKLTRLCKKMVPALATEALYFPETLISYTPMQTVMVWWHPAGVRHLYFDESTGISSGKAPIPAMLFKYSDNRLFNFALAENRRPTEDSDIYHSPFNNFGCMGSARLPQNPTPRDIAKLESVFFRSAFTDHNPPRLKGTTRDKLWKSLVNSGKKKFPIKHLVKADTLGHMLKGATSD